MPSLANSRQSVTSSTRVLRLSVAIGGKGRQKGVEPLVGPTQTHRKGLQLLRVAAGVAVWLDNDGFRRWADLAVAQQQTHTRRGKA